VIGDGGSAADSPITSIGVTGQICSNSARIASGSWNSVCIQAFPNSPGVISIQNYGSALPQNLNFLINGTSVSIPTGASNFLLGNPPFTAGDIPAFFNSIGTVIDSGVAASGGVITKGQWSGTPIPVAGGGTGATTQAAAQTNLGLGTMSTQNANNVAITGGTITGLPTPTNASDAAIKSYVDGLATGLKILAQSNLAATTALPNSPTYNNGSSGVGATLTAGSNTTLTVDGTLATLGSVVLVNGQASAFQNGIYTVTTAGSGAAAWVLTRASYFDTPAQMVAGSYTFINGGSTNLNTSWVLAATTTTVGTTAVNFNLFSSIGTGVSSIDGKNGPFTTGNGVTSTAGNVIQLSNAQTSARQAILSGSVGVSGFSNFATAASGLNISLAATNTPLTMSFAYGFNSATGAVDYIGQEAADSTNFWANLPANQYTFLSIDRNTSTGALTATSTLMRPQKGPVFNTFSQALLHLQNSTLDDWNNAWSTIGAVSYSTSTIKFNTYSMYLNGLGGYINNQTGINNPGQGNWTMDVWVNLVSNVSSSIFSVGNIYGAFVGTNASGNLLLYLSSTGSSWDISNGSASSGTISTGSWHHVALTFDGSNYRLFLDGVVVVSVTSSVIVWPNGTVMAVGEQTSLSTTTNGYFDEFDFVPFARWVTNFTPPTSPYTVSGDWFDTNNMQMKTATGAGPTWSIIQRMYVAEAVDGNTTISSVYNYSSQSPYHNGYSHDQSSTRYRVGNTIYYGGTPLFINGSTTIASPVTWILGPSLVPPDAVSATVQIDIFHTSINSSGYDDCTLVTMIPGPSGSYVIAGYGGLLLSGVSGINQNSSFQEQAGTIFRIPVINGITAFETEILGTTCSTGTGGNAAHIVQGVLIGYDMP
jgi:hypothetical protein